MQRPIQRVAVLFVLLLSILGAQNNSTATTAERLLQAWARDITPAGRTALVDAAPAADITLRPAVNVLGEKLRGLGKFDEARDAFQLCLALSERAKDEAEATVSLQLIGGINRLQGKYKDAEATYRLALARAAMAHDTIRESLILNNLASVFGAQGRYSDAAEMYRKSLQLLPEKTDPRNLASPYQNLAIIYSLQGDHARALDSFNKALDLYKIAKDRNKIALTFSNLGFMEMRQGNHAAADLHYRAAYAIRAELKDRAGIAETGIELGRLDGLKGNTAAAMKQLRDSLAIAVDIKYQSQVELAKNYIAELQLQSGDAAGADATYSEVIQLAETMNDPAEACTATRGRAEAQLSLGKPAEALRLADRAAELARSLRDPEAQWRTESLAGDALRAQGDLAGARKRFQAAVSIVESQRFRIAGGDQERRRYFEQSAFPYQSLVRVALDAGDKFAALQYAESSHARVLREILDRGPVSVDGRMTAEERERERDLRSEISVLNAGLARAKADRKEAVEKDLLAAQSRHDLFLQQVYAAHPELRTFRADSAPLSPADLDALVPDAKTALIEFVTAETGTEIFIASRAATGGPVAITTVRLKNTRADLEKKTVAYRAALAARDPGFRLPAQALYRLLIAPLAPALIGKQQLLLVPDGPLWELPFQTLADSQGRFWLDAATIGYAPSLTVLRDLRKLAPRAAETGVLAMGNPVNDGFVRAPETGVLVRNIEAIYGRDRVTALTGALATEAAFRKNAGAAGMLHLATHAVLDVKNPLYSYLVFSKGAGAPDPDNDGRLEAWEILRMPLTASLAILSACETARGTASPGEGLVGLSWALFAAGVRSTVLSQWSIDSAGTSALMTRMHKELKNGKTPSAALREASFFIRRDPRYRHPFYWGAFVGIGPW